MTRRSLLATSVGLGATGLLLGGAPARAPGPGRRRSLEQLLIETTREECLEEVWARMQRGVTRERLAAALLDVAMRSVNGHHVGFVVHAGLVAARLAPLPDQPLLWCVDYFKSWQSRRSLELAPLPELADRELPLDVAAADAQLARSLVEMDGGALSRALVALQRTAGPAAAWERVWRVSSRDWTFVGHRAIAPAWLHRSATSLGVGTEPMLRWLGPFQFYWHATGGRGQCWAANSELARESAAQVAPAHRRGAHDPGPTRDLLAAIRTGDVADARDLALAQLTGAAGSTAAVWDAVHLAAAELLLRTEGSTKLGQFPVHGASVADSLHYAAATSQVPSTRLLATLQGVSWLAEFTSAAGADSELGAARIDALEARDVGPDEQRELQKIVSQLRPRERVSRTGVSAERDDQRAAAPATLGWTRRFPASTALRRAVVENVLRSGGADAHNLKLPVALMQMSDRVSPRWRARIEASLIHTMPAPRAAESDFFERLAQLG